jgi:4a-hydroxytetrahydrobiopterin dehydratase
MDKAWHMASGHLVRDFIFANFIEAMVFVNKVARVAEREQHHPDILIQWNKVRLELWTHTADAVTAKDKSLAKAIDDMLTL